ncbi:aldolase [Gloeophyllum trabeum ATCC 11539]|uniref:fructose-bisphosphate aldolase n=1 Tax=Gloeophyllum trabeum (strain ATCC 11539 / FP-39264 / Madison 617) TaxID=670483 RepID=S7Q4Z8_GLOTA|nr:aldolase [Gloeophyllum trabeum ATCC 11539]EPQ54593.1 aldolase [Gloeophyllum trabeum ATCC 11539]
MSNLNATSTPGYGFSPANTASFSSNPSDANAYLYPYHSTAIADQLISTAQTLVNPRGKGIYATDETPEGIEARLIAALGEDTKWTDAEKREKRRRFRECLYESLPTQYISGVILYAETLLDFQLGPVLASRGIIPGIRADTDSHPLPISPLEPATQGLDDLLPRLTSARLAGARFTKWRAPILCTSAAGGLPTHAALEAQAESLARFAAISQQAGLVPIVEPDVDFAEDADLKRSVEVHVKIISMIFARCAQYGVLLEGSLIKPSFPQPGLKHPSRATTTSEDIALATATVLARSVPIAVAGVVFLSGGLSDSESILYLNKLNVLVNASTAPSPFSRLPPLSFSFGRGLQGDAMKKWVKGDEEGAKKAFEVRAKACYDAARGQLNV